MPQANQIYTIGFVKLEGLKREGIIYRIGFN